MLGLSILWFSERDVKLTAINRVKFESGVLKAERTVEQTLFTVYSSSETYAAPMRKSNVQIVLDAGNEKYRGEPYYSFSAPPRKYI